MQFSSSQLLTVDNCPSPQQLKSWCDTIQQSLISLFETGSNSIDFATLLHLQYIIVTNNGASMLYHQLTQEMDSKVVMIKSRLESTPIQDYTQTLSATWRHYLYVIDSLRAFCPHLEQSFASPGHFFSLSDHALKRWHFHILSNTQTLNTISDVLLTAFNLAREADGVLPNYVTNMASMLTLLDPLTHSVATFFIEDRYIQDISLVCGTRRTQLILASQQATEDYEKMLAQAQSDATEMNGEGFDEEQFAAEIRVKHSYVVDYCQKVELWIAQEMALCQQVLSPSTAQRVKALLLEEFIGQADAILVEDQFDGLLYHFKHHNSKQVGIIYNALTISGSDVGMLSDEIRSLIKEETAKVIQEASKLSNPVIFVNAIYSLFNSYTQVIQTSCLSNAAMLVAVQNSIEVTIGSSASAPRLLALYIDQLIRTALQTIGLTNVHDVPISTQRAKQLDPIKLAEKLSQPLQTASTYCNTISPSALQQGDRDIMATVQWKSALQARWRVLYELELQVTKWVELTKFVIDKDLYEENHRMLSVERLLSNIHLNHGYNHSSMVMESLSTLLSSKPDTTNGGMNGLSPNGGLTSFPAISLGNAITTAISQGITNSAPNQAGAVANERFLNGFSSSNSVQPAISVFTGEHSGPSTNGGGRGNPIAAIDIFEQLSTLKLFLFLSRNPNVPLFILFEYYLCGKLASSNGPGIPTQQFEALFRDVTASAGLSSRFAQLPKLKESISSCWKDYVNVLRTSSGQKSLDEIETDNWEIGNGGDLDNNDSYNDNSADRMGDNDDDQAKGDENTITQTNKDIALLSNAHLQSTFAIDDIYTKNLLSISTSPKPPVPQRALLKPDDLSPTDNSEQTPTPKTLYHIPLDYIDHDWPQTYIGSDKPTNDETNINDSNTNKKPFIMPQMVPLVVTQGVWNTSISPTLPSNFPATPVVKTQMSTHLLKTSHFLYPTLKIPFEILILLNLFQERYTANWFSARKMIWNYSVSTAVISASFRHPQLETVKTYDFICSFFQLLILNLFNYKEMYTYSEIVHLTGIINPAHQGETTMQLKSALLALCHPKVGILAKTPNTPHINESDGSIHQFSWNHSFSHSSRTFTIPKINTASMQTIAAQSAQNQAKQSSGMDGNPSNLDQTGAGLSSVAQNLSTNANPSQQTLFRRETAVDAAIVRLLKKHKELTHAVLVSKIKQELGVYSFQPDDAFIKQRIEQQIDQFNIERDDDDRKLYRYL